ncbi:MAG: hypothetical protein U9R74_13020 [Pseudomonadota bacterium]|nr:hypothetical protein [Pseudomonadota bacterium]
MSVTAFVLAGTIAVAGEALAAGQTLLPTRESGSVQLRLAGNRISGQFVNRSLSDVLDEIGKQSNFQYRASEPLLRYPVSGSFDGISISDALKQILKPFDYLLVIGSTGEPRQVFVLDEKRKSEDTSASDSLDALPGEDLVSTDPLEDADHTDGERFLFEAFDDNASLPPEFEGYTSAPSPEEEFTGPTIATGNAQDLPEFEPIISASGPDIPDLNTVEFPEFEPYYSEEGPTIPKF